jgi:hypothetical protein
MMYIIPTISSSLGLRIVMDVVIALFSALSIPETWVCQMLIMFIIQNLKYSGFFLKISDPPENYCMEFEPLVW